MESVDLSTLFVEIKFSSDETYSTLDLMGEQLHSASTPFSAPKDPSSNLSSTFPLSDTVFNHLPSLTSVQLSYRWVRIPTIQLSDTVIQPGRKTCRLNCVIE